MLGSLSGGLLACCACPRGLALRPGLAVRAVSAIGAHLELAGGLGMIGLGILRSPDALHSLGLRTEGHSLSRPCASQQGWRRSVVWVSSEQPKRAAVAQLRRPASLCFGMCSGSTAEQPDCRAASLARGRRPGRAAPARRVGDRFWGQKADEKTDFLKTLAGSYRPSLGYITMQKAHPWRTQGVAGSDSSILMERR